MRRVKGLPSFSDRIIRIYLLGASVLLGFYIFAFHAGILLTENALVERRLEIVAPYYFELFGGSTDEVIVIDPVLTMYTSHSALPLHIQSKVSPDWQGTLHLLLEDEREFQVIAREINIGGGPKTFYAVEDSNALEWDDTQFVMTEVLLGLVGIVMFLVTMAYMFKAAKRMASPFKQVAKKLHGDASDDFDPIAPRGDETTELNHMVSALNEYRSRLRKQLEREKSFTRYVSHELRTPMMIITGAISHLRRVDSENISKPVKKIARATEQMQDLIHTFLLLARDQDQALSSIAINNNLLDQLCEELEGVITANNVAFHFQLQADFCIDGHPQLFKAVIHNLLKNAFACSVDGRVVLMMSETGMEVIDDGVGLDAKPRGYEGFGIGLVLVQDICSKYGWRFALRNNPQNGCTASIQF